MTARHVLSVADFTPTEIEGALALAAELKSRPRQPLLEGRTIALAFEKPSLRTRVSFDVGIYQLGGHAIYLSQMQIGVDSREPVQDIARVLSRMVDGIVSRTHDHEHLERMTRYASIPVINALSDLEHPCQALADLLTITEIYGSPRGRTLAYVGDGNNVANSLVLACASVGMNFSIACPDGYLIPDAIWSQAERLAEASGATITRVSDPTEAARGADVLYTDVWTSMGQESERLERERAFAGYQINAELVSAARPGAVVMHDLPAHRGEEISNDTLERFADVIFTQAENRLHAQKAVMVMLMNPSTVQQALDAGRVPAR